MRLSFVGGLLTVGVLVCGCASQYTPKVSLGESPETIPLRVELHQLKESPEPKPPGQPYGVMAEHVKQAQRGELSGNITRAVLEDFRDNDVFQQIDTHLDHPDAILTGTINTFYETYRPKGWTQVPYGKSLAKLLDADTYMGTTEVDLDLVLRQPDGPRIGTYHGHAANSDEFVPNKDNQPGARLNWALSQAIYRIRQALLEDATHTNFTHSASPTAGAGTERPRSSRYMGQSR